MNQNYVKNLENRRYSYLAYHVHRTKTYMIWKSFSVHIRKGLSLKDAGTGTFWHVQVPVQWIVKQTQLSEVRVFLLIEKTCLFMNLIFNVIMEIFDKDDQNDELYLDLLFTS